MDVAEIERLLRVGLCSPAKHMAEPCATCAKYEAAIAAVRELVERAERAEERLVATESALSVRFAMRREIEETLGLPEAPAGDAALVAALDRIRSMASAEKRAEQVRAEAYAAGVLAERGHTTLAISEREGLRRRAEDAERERDRMVAKLALERTSTRVDAG